MILEKILTKQIAQDHVYKITVKELQCRRIDIRDIELTGKNKQDWILALSGNLRGCPQNIIQDKVTELIAAKCLIPIKRDNLAITIQTKYYINPKILLGIN